MRGFVTHFRTHAQNVIIQEIASKKINELYLFVVSAPSIQPFLIAAEDV